MDILLSFQASNYRGRDVTHVNNIHIPNKLGEAADKLRDIERKLEPTFDSPKFLAESNEVSPFHMATPYES